MSIPLLDTFNIPTGILTSTTSELLLARDTDGDVKLFNGASYLRGSGTVNYLPVYSATNTLTSSILLQTGGNIGIGLTTNIDHKLKVGGGIYGDYLQVNTAYSNGNVPGRFSWDSDHDLIELGLNNQFSARLPQDEVWSCIAATTITKGQLVYASGTLGNSGKIQATPFIANGTIPARFLIGVATENAAQGESFHAMRSGILRGIDTSTYTEGQDLWASITTVGGYQVSSPVAPNQKLSIAFVVASHAQNGELAIRINNGFELGGASDTQITSPSANQLLRYNNNRWENWTHNFVSLSANGTTNRLARFTGATTLGDSLIQDDGSFVSIGIAPSAGRSLSIQRTITGNVESGGVFVAGAIQNDVTTSAYGVRTFLQIALNSNTLPIYTHFLAGQATSGALQGPLTTQVGFQVNNISYGTNSYGFRGLIASGVNRWNLYMDGTAINYLRGALLLNRTVSTGEQLQVTGSAIITSTLTVPSIGNSSGVSATNTWTFTSNVNIPLTPTLATHATSKSYVDNLIATGIKEGIPVRSISLSNITLSGLQTVSGVSLIAGDRVLVAGQTNATQNGIYIASSSSWTRATDSDSDLELRGYQYLITAGTFVNAKYRNTNESAITIGTTAITYVVYQGAETDPVFAASPAATITSQLISNWNDTHSIWGSHTPSSIFAERSTADLAENASFLYFTDARARNAISLTTNSTSGVATYNNSTGVLNIPNYTITNAVTGVLTTNRIPVATSSSSLGNSIITNSLANNILIDLSVDGGGKLQVGGSIRQTSVTSNLLFADSNGVLTGYANTASIALGTGTVGRIVMYTGTTGVTQNIGNSLLFQNGSNIGLNTTTPAYNLDIGGTLGVSNTLSVYSSTSASKVDITTNANGVISTYINNSINVFGDTNSFIISNSNSLPSGGSGYRVQIDSGTTGGNGLFVRGNIYSTATITSFSDIRLKSELERIENAIDKIKKISGYTYLFNDKRTLGLISQEVKNIAPEAIEEKGGYMTLNYQGFSAVIVEAIKELSNEIQKLKEKCQ